MERRSGRLKSFPQKYMAEDGSDSEMADHPEAETSSTATKKPRPRKRREVAFPNVPSIQAQFKKLRGKRGLLKDVVDMPMDVLYEVYLFFLCPKKSLDPLPDIQPARPSGLVEFSQNH